MLAQNSGVLVSHHTMLEESERTWVDGREVISPNPAAALWKQGSNRS